MKDPTLSAQKWATNLVASAPSIKAGVQAVTVSPGQLAAAQADVWLANLQASRQKWIDRVKVPLDVWQSATIDKGIPRIQGGANAAIPKVQQFLTTFLPHVERGVQQMRSQIPRGSIEQNIQRAVFMMRWNATYNRPAGG